MRRALACLVLLVANGDCPGAIAADAHWVQVNGHAIYYEIHGSGPPVLMLHGGGNTITESFSHQLEAFAASHQLITPEQVGQGHTPDVAGPLSYAGMTEDTAELLRQLHVVNADAIGISDGGNLALMLAIRHPELVRRLVVSGANLDPAGLREEMVAQVRAIAPARDGTPATVGQKLRRLWLTSPTPKELSPALLKGIHKPVLVMAGDNDVIRGEHTLLIYQSLPQALLWILPGTGHRTFSQRADWVNPIVLSFLSQP